MRIFLLAISFPPCSYSSTTCLAFALHDGPWAVVRLADMVHNSSLTGQWAICYFIPFADICHIIFYFSDNCNPFFEIFFDFFEFFLLRPLFVRFPIFQSTLAFFSFHPFPRFAFPISTLPCVSFKPFISTPPSVSCRLYANHSQTFSSTPRLILYILHIHSFIFSNNPPDFLLFPLFAFAL